MKVYFVTRNDRKIEESKSRLDRFMARVQSEGTICPPIELGYYRQHLDELLAFDLEKIAWKKTLEAYRILRLPCVVEHGGLFLDAWRSSDGKRMLLGGIGGLVWSAVHERMCGFLRPEDKRGAEAHSVVGYCDGMHIRLFSAMIEGEITDRALGEGGFRWDPIFKPKGSSLTYGEMSPEARCETSPDEKAWDAFLSSLATDLRASRR